VVRLDAEQAVQKTTSVLWSGVFCHYFQLRAAAGRAAAPGRPEPVSASAFAMLCLHWYPSRPPANSCVSLIALARRLPVRIH